MSDSDEDPSHDLLQYIIFALLSTVVLFILLFKLWKNPAYRERVLDTVLCKNCSGGRVHYDEADLRTLQELEEANQRQNVGINGAYRLYQARRSRLSLRLASWREDVKRGDGDDDRLHHKLAQIQAAQQQAQTAAPTTDSGRNDIRGVEINNRVDESTRSWIPSPSSPSEASSDVEEKWDYELASSPRSNSNNADDTGCQFVAIAE